MPTPEQRQYLDRRLGQIEAWCAPIARTVLDTQIRGTFSMLRGPTMSEDEVAFEIGVFADVLGDLPAFAVIAACRDYLTGKRGDGWKPKPPELRIAAQEHLGAIVKERRQIEAVLAAVEAPKLAAADKRQAAVAMARGLLPMIAEAGEKADYERRGIPYDPKPVREDPEAVLFRVQGAPPVQVSEAFLKATGRPPRDLEAAE